MADKEIKLVGSFKDDITPKLKKLSRELDVVTSGFTKMQSKLRPIARDMGVLAMASDRLGASLQAQRSGLESNIRAMQQYKTVVGQVARAQRAVRPAPIAPSPAAPRTPRGGGGGGAVPRGGGGGGGEGGIGFGALAAASFVGGAALTAATAGLQKLAAAAHGFVAAGSNFEQGTIQMAATIQTLGKVGDFGKSLEMAKKYNSQVEKIAAALPGSTQDYLEILKMTLDDQIQAYGSAEGVTKNLKKGEQSFSALFGMSAQLAGLSPAIAAMDINQLRMNPENLRNVQFLTRNPTLAKFYQEELKKTGGDFFKALDRAMQRAITPEQIEALKNTFDSAYQSLVTTFTSPTGIFGAAREVMVTLSDGTREMMSTMDILGMFMRNLNGIIEVLVGTGIEPMQALNQFLYEMGYYVYAFRRDLEYLKQIGTLDIQNLGRILGKGLTDMILKIVDMFLNLDFKTLLSGIDKFFAGFIEGIMEGLKTGNWGSIGAGLVKTVGAFLTTWTGKILLAIAALKFAPNLTAGLARGARGVQGPMPTAGGTRGMMMGGRLRESFAGTPMGRMGTRMSGAAARMAPGMAAFGQRAMGAGRGLMAGAGRFAMSGGGAGALTAAFSVADTISQVASINEQISQAKTPQEKAALATERGKSVAAGAGGAVGAVAGGALGAAIAGPIGAMIGAQLGSTIGTAIGPAIGNWWNSSAAPFLTNLWSQITAGLTSFGTMVMNGIRSVGTFFQQVGAKIMSAFSALPGFLQTALAVIFNPWGLALNLLKTYAGNIYNFITTLPGRIASLLNPFARPPAPTAKPKYNGRGGSMPLHQAIATEMRHKPPGSSLVIANSSETIIPAYRGYNTDRLRASSAANGMGGGSGVSMSGITINVNGASGDVRQIADQIAGELLAAMTTASYTELYSS